MLISISERFVPKIPFMAPFYALERKMLIPKSSADLKVEMALGLSSIAYVVFDEAGKTQKAAARRSRKLSLNPQIAYLRWDSRLN